MTRREFEANANTAKTLQEHAGFPDNAFWEGYMRGLRRCYHGDSFGDAEMHEKYLAAADEPDDFECRSKGLGYRAGLAGVPVASALWQYLDFDDSLLKKEPDEIWNHR